jgi:serine protease
VDGSTGGRGGYAVEGAGARSLEGHAAVHGHRERGLTLLAVAAVLVVGSLVPGSAPRSAAASQPSEAPSDIRADTTIRGAAGAPVDASVRRLVVSATSPRAAAASATASGRAGAVRVGRPIGDAHVVLDLGRPLSIDAATGLAARLVADGAATSAEPDLPVQALRVPDDPGFPLQWHLHGPSNGSSLWGIDAAGAWQAEVGDAGIVVGVLDSGIRQHPELAGRLVAGYDFVTDDGGRDDDPTDTGDGCPSRGEPDTWHGLHVAGTIGAATNNGAGISGVDQAARIQPVRVLGACGGSLSDVADGIRWASGLPVAGVPANQTPARVLNLSLGAPATSCPGFLRSAIADARAAGAVVVAAAGNANADLATEPIAPAICDGVLTVAATSHLGGRAWYSNHGAAVDLAAPGGDSTAGRGVDGMVLSLSYDANLDRYGYAWMQGTSMAAPHVTGVAALLLAQDPTRTPSQVEERLRSTTTPFPTWDVGGSSRRCTTSGTHRCGSGILDARTAIGTEGQVSAPAPGAPILGPASSGDLAITVSWPPAPARSGPITYRLHRADTSSCTASSWVVTTVAVRSATDTTVEHDGTYRYCVTSVDGGGRVSVASNAVTATARDLSPPPAPTLSATATTSRVELSWTASSDPTGPVTYRVHRSTGSSCSTSSSLIATRTTSSHSDGAVSSGATYRYCVTATDGAGNRSVVSNVAAVTVPWTTTDCHALVGDWNGSGRDGIGWWCNGRTRLRHANGTITDFTYGRTGDVPIVADWNGNGRDTVSVIRDGTWHINNKLTGGTAERTFTYGRVSRGDTPIAGDWTRTGRSLPGIIRDREWHLRHTQTGGTADHTFTYGRLTAGDLPLWGDWNGDRRTTPGIVRNGEWHLRNSLSGGTAHLRYTYGRVLAGDIPVTGDWTGNGIDTPAIVRDTTWYLKYTHSGGNADRTITLGTP